MLGRLLSATVETRAPDPGGGPPLVQTRTSDFDYDSTTGLLIAEIIEPGEGGVSPLKLTTTYTHDAFGNKTSATTTGAGLGAGRVVTTTYDSIGRFPLKTANALGHEETRTYSPELGVLLSSTGPNGLTTSWEYDGFARPACERRADGTESITRHCWSGSGAPAGALYYIETQSTGSAPAVTFYDKMGRALSAWAVHPGGADGNPRIVTTETLYDAMGRAHATSLPHFIGAETPGWSQILEYDLLNRPLAISTPDDEAQGGAVVSTIEYAGLVTRTTNPLGQVEEVTKDTQGRVIKRVNNATGSGAERGEIRYSYDAYDNLLKTAVYREDGAPVETTFAYDNRGRKTGMASPDMGAWTYAYNALGELLSQTDAKGQTTSMTYDALGRIVTRVDRDAASAVACTTTWTYDDTAISGAKGKGKPSAILVQTPGKSDYKETFTYDSLGRASTHTRRIDGTDYPVTQEYDAVTGRPSVIVYPGGFRVRNVYNDLGFLKEVRADGGGVAGGIYRDVQPGHLFWQADSYAVSGAVESSTLGNGLTCDRVISPVTGRVRAIATGIGGGTHAQYHAYNYDLLGQVTNRRDFTLNREEVFSYDGLNRLSSYSLNGGPATTVAYDALGNITQKSDVGNYYYASGRPHAATSAGALAYAYDANGNQTQALRAGVVERSVEWSVANQVEKITNAVGNLWTTFRFGASRERIVQEHGNGSKTIHIGSLLEIVTGADDFREEKYHVYSPEGRSATRTLRSDSTVETRYYHTDGLGSITAVSDEFGRVEKRFAYDPWGNRDMPVDTHTGPGGGITRGFTDHEHLDDFGLIHMNGRVFDPALGRFLSADPFVQDAGNSQAYNRYSYCGNNPLNATDPSGYLSFDDVFRVVVIAAFVVAVAYTAGMAAGGFATLLGSMAAGAAGGFTGGFVGTLAYGGNLSAAFKAGAIGAVIGAATAAASYGIGVYFNSGVGVWANDYANWTGRTLAHAVVGGISSEAQGGEFRHGFYASAISNGIMHLGGPQSGKMAGTGGVMGFMGGTKGGIYIAARTATAALIGGTAAELSGGKFVNGAVTSATQHLFNAEASAAQKRALNRQLSSVKTIEEAKAFLLKQSELGIANAKEAYDALTRGNVTTRFADDLDTGVMGQAETIYKQARDGSWHFQSADVRIRTGLTGAELLSTMVHEAKHTLQVNQVINITYNREVQAYTYEETYRKSALFSAGRPEFRSWGKIQYKAIGQYVHENVSANPFYYPGMYD